MPKPINKTIGQVMCPIRDCECMAAVKREKNHDRGALYAVCPTHGRISTNGAQFKAALAEVIEKTMAGPDEKPEPKPEPIRVTPMPAGTTVQAGKRQPLPELKPAPVPAQPAPDKAGPGFLETANKQLQDFWQ